MKRKTANVPEPDAFGQEMRACLNKQDSYEIIERDDGFIAVAGKVSDYFKTFPAWPDCEKRAISLAKGRVLDIGAGAGRVALHLQKDGMNVTGIDNSPLAIKVCKQRGLKDARLVSIDEIPAFAPNSFDTILLFGNNFGLFRNPRDARSLLRQMLRITTPQARIIAESLDPYNTRDPAHLNYHKFNRKRGKMPGQLRLRVRFRTVIGPWFEYLIVSPKEMSDIIQGTGWRIKRFVKQRGAIYIGVMEKE